MTTKIVLITGTSSGIGLASSIAAACAGWHVIATMRDLGKGTPLLDAARAAGVDDAVEVRRLDVTDEQGAAQCIDSVVRDYGRLDAVVNNAGAGHVGTLETDAIKDIRAVLEVNFFGVLNVSKAALPSLRAARGRLVTVSSVGGIVGQPFNEAYCAAKFAVEGFMEALAPVASAVGVQVSVVEPGAVASEFVSNAGVERALDDDDNPYSEALRNYLARTDEAYATAQTPAEVAAVVLDTLTAERPPLRAQTSEAARAFVGAKLADLDGSAIQRIVEQW